ncbi:MAG: tetratricopeptide repeat protein [Candidatus Obscuribacterales bacterium]|nr:tetratricopeptide repeat protein [Candidatus Obscuribacterales bacterium]
MKAIGASLFICFFASVLAQGASASEAFERSKFPARAKREAFTRSCEFDRKGVLLEEQGKAAEAVIEFRKAIEAYPSYAVPHSNLGNALSDLHKYSEAVLHYQKAVELAPDFAAAYCNMADALTKQKNYTAAEMACNKALRVDPGYVPAMTNLAEVYLETNRPSEARAVLIGATGLATTAGLKKIIQEDLAKAKKMLDVQNGSGVSLK